MKSLMNTRYGRSDWIRTSGLLVPNQALYQTEPHPVFSCFKIVPHMRRIVNIFFAIALFFLLSGLRGRTVPLRLPSARTSSRFLHRQMSDAFCISDRAAGAQLISCDGPFENFTPICEYQFFQIKSCEMGK